MAIFNAEYAEIRRGPQRKTKRRNQNGNPRRWVPVLVSLSGGQPEGGSVAQLANESYYFNNLITSIDGIAL